MYYSETVWDPDVYLGNRGPGPGESGKVHGRGEKWKVLRKVEKSGWIQST